MNKPIALAFLVVGIILLIYGYNASQSVASSASRLLNGSPTNHTMWLVLSGAVCSVIGLVGLTRGSK